MSKKITGSFVFRNEGEGCLTSKYYNGSLEGPFVEAVKRETPDAQSDDPFLGNYTSTWIEDGHTCVCADLTISRGPSVNTYILTWITKHPSTPTKFVGKAMLFDNLLVGSYFDS